MTEWPDVEGGMLTYLKSKLTLPKGVYLGIPVGAGKSPNMFPLVTIQRVGGGDDPSEAPIDRALMQFNVWGTSDRDKARCWNCVAELRGVLSEITGATSLDANVVAFGASVNNIVYAPDGVDGRPRYVVTALVTAANP